MPLGKSYSSKCNSKVYGLLECDSSIENTERDESVSSERVFYWKRDEDGADAECGYHFHGISRTQL